MQTVLGSWKEIANYLGKGVRTVQRWERCSGLPIHRPSGSSKGVVIAFPAELDRWARRQDPATVHPSEHQHTSAELHRNSKLILELAHRTRLLLDNTEELMKNWNYFLECSRRRPLKAEPDISDSPGLRIKAPPPAPRNPISVLRRSS
jgi:hypothetical protein